MKKFIFLMLIIAAICTCSICFATEDDTANNDEIEIDNYDDFYDAYNTGNTQSEVKEYYREFLAYSREQDALKTNSEAYKAKVVNVGSTTTTYSMSYYTPYKITYQPVKVEILEGEYVGKIFDAQYLLTADTYENIKTKEVSVGDKVFVSFDTTEDGDIEPYIKSYDTRNYKFPMMVILAMVFVILFIILGKSEGLKNVLLIALIFDLIFVITIPQIMKYNSVVTLINTDKNFPTRDEIDADDTITVLETNEDGLPIKVEVVRKNNSLIWLIIIDTLLVSAMSLVNKLGLSKKVLYALALTVCALIFIALLLLGINIIMKLDGNSFEAVSIAENIINRNINFEVLYIFSALMIASVLVPNVVSKVFLCVEEDNYKENIIKFIGDQITLLCAVAFVLVISKIIALVIFKYEMIEFLNSEMVLIEFIRVVVLSITILLVRPLAELIVRKTPDEEVQE